MYKLRRNKGIIAFLVLAFLGMQASSAHIHLPAHHDHDGSHHAHQARGHVHNLASHHRDTIDVAATELLTEQDEHNIVELGHDCTSPKSGKHNKQADAISSPAFSYTELENLSHLAPPSQVRQPIHRYSWSHQQARAPPLSAS